MEPVDIHIKTDVSKDSDVTSSLTQQKVDSFGNEIASMPADTTVTLAYNEALLAPAQTEKGKPSRTKCP